jgi:hypothetical protein
VGVFFTLFIIVKYDGGHSEFLFEHQIDGRVLPYQENFKIILFTLTDLKVHESFCSTVIQMMETFENANSDDLHFISWDACGNIHAHVLAVGMLI